MASDAGGPAAVIVPKASDLVAGQAVSFCSRPLEVPDIISSVRPCTSDSSFAIHIAEPTKRVSSNHLYHNSPPRRGPAHLLKVLTGLYIVKLFTLRLAKLPSGHRRGCISHSHSHAPGFLFAAAALGAGSIPAINCIGHARDLRHSPFRTHLKQANLSSRNRCTFPDVRAST